MLELCSYFHSAGLVAVRINDALADRVCRRVVLHFKWAVKLDQRRPLIHPQSIWPKVGAVLGVGAARGQSHPLLAPPLLGKDP